MHQSNPAVPITAAVDVHPIPESKPGGRREGHSTKFYTGRLHPEVQTLTLLCTICDRKGTPFVHLP